MSRNYKFHNPEGVYFVSFAVVNWLAVFTNKKYIDIVLDSLVFCQQKKGMEIHAWCIMPTHIHLIFRSVGSQKPALLLGDFKRFTSRNIVNALQEDSHESRREEFLRQFQIKASKSTNVADFQFWQHDNHPIELWTNDVIQQKIDYIHNNPVKAGIVFNPEDYLYSSATDYAGKKGLIDDIAIFQFFKL